MLLYKSQEPLKQAVTIENQSCIWSPAWIKNPDPTEPDFRWYSWSGYNNVVYVSKSERQRRRTFCFNAYLIRIFLLVIRCINISSGGFHRRLVLLTRSFSPRVHYVEKYWYTRNLYIHTRINEVKQRRSSICLVGITTHPHTHARTRARTYTHEHGRTLYKTQTEKSRTTVYQRNRTFWPRDLK